ncbi:MAG: PAS domain-containing protein, partial [Armatimonadota bacterium]
MKIGTRLKLIVLVPALMAIVISLAYLYSYRIIKINQQNSRIIRQIMISTNELDTLVRSYLLYSDDRPKKQFMAEHDAVIRLISTIKLRNSDQLQLLDNIRTNIESAKTTFLRLVSNNEQAKTTADRELVVEAANLLQGQLLVKSREVVSDSLNLESLVDKEITTAQRRIRNLILYVIITTTIPLTIVLLRTGKHISTSITSLRNGIEVIGTGNLSHRIDMPPVDELGELAGSFNHMTEQLQTLTVSKDVLQEEIEERKKTEEALKESERLLRDVIDGSPSIIFLKDREGRFITINKRLEAMLGISDKDLKGKTDYDIFPKDIADINRTNDIEIMSTGRVRQIEETADFLDGHHVYLETKFPLTNAAGQIYGIGNISHDITVRKKIENELLEAKDLLEHQVHLLQRALIPAKPQIIEGYSVASAYIPAYEGTEIGGDFIDVFQTEDNKVGILIGDVSGKGIESAALAATTRSTIRAFAYDSSAPGDALSHANSLLTAQQVDYMQFVTAFLVILD